jgi:hypothetical protein
MSALDPQIIELAEVYAADSGVPVPVCAAFIASDLEPPRADQYNQGFDSTQLRLVQDFYAAHDPNGSRAEWSEQEAAA